jgi:hypothetical protein
MATKTLDIGAIVKSASTPKRLTSMEVRKLENKQGELYAFRLESTGDRKGSSEVRIKQVNGRIVLEDYVSLPEKNSGFGGDIVLLKQMMYEDRGAVASGAVTDLHHGVAPKGYKLSFSVTREEAQKALHCYMGICLEVMGEFFKGFGEIDLAFSMARGRVGR